MKIKELENKKVLILGIGREGLDTLAYLKKVFPKKIFAIADQKEELDNKTKKAVIGMDLFLGEDYLKNVNDFDVIIKSPGIPFFRYKDKLTSQTELFFDNCPSKIIGITGTKGKSTVASLLHSMIKGSYLVGNIETPSLSFLAKAKADDIFVCELSSHQLMNLKRSPHIAVFLNIYPEHLDYYKNFEEYFSAKKNIYKYQSESDYLIFNPEIDPKTKANKIEINIKDFANFLKDNQQFLEITHIDNLIAVLNVVKLLNIPEKEIIKALNNYKRLPHRLEFVGEFKGIRFYDDSIATIPEAAVYAIDSLGDDVETIILGGLDRGIKYDKLVKRIKKSNIKNIIAFPDSGEKIVRNIRSRIYKVDNMEDAVDLAYKHTTKGRICLLSPASPSFNLFKDYKERGDLFKGYVNEKAKS
ncbi:MAG: UDP-N-acetylmuramoyl-L-alanine--D-glutamate ligase [Candidatus Pacebacteria bacterium]|nr:UDP-N-acetylmuramoyl-L-alanine--D-glutamate ligase [Candidatus Paceibacterota bacterium]MDD3283693.1 UDP-N-acetylmuramoyl-L-alanine--D-glutamate ligase [Candidatus Paceibacterota bacterium]MDD3969832.1 UDP-N-acetylmuramoyl-L-alanine--D-glutamate ligase [Candidatus Paceibacterota bacterium]MDD4737756.1 UDP-N-acetylmuramoyl-L-alanine--D-glutamate ligase [Candidatus Paceibacterota bacterium]